MNPHSTFSLARVFEGWDGYHASLVRAIAPLTAEQLSWRPSQAVRSAGALARHIAVARVEWFARMAAPGSAELAASIEQWNEDDDGNRHVAPDALPIATSAAELVPWLDRTWGMIARTLAAWTVDDLWTTFRHRWNGQVYAVSRQWTIWRIMAHDIHHGGQIARILALQDIEAFELRALGGHTILPPLADSQ